ncbi:hypothetical protein K470DRAFT_259011 [Piedraia hortae CBS 480.64]|uniref:Ubiquitin-activating enzyme E1-like n=1 Tax=Piedraia hortae CBS 480.64 TaxID=1314780 RepID=A0A6A7BVM4_9PEZI|nr:hypothetical protein K470DRAFT_259011 [Piedraia hortae CBS 480.64]
MGPKVQPREAPLARTLSPAVLESIKRSKVLLVGAGGIGCELLKDLVLSSFLHITLIDLDTIDLSNLNRQFLFRKQHIGQSKARVAKATALQFNPSVTIDAKCANILAPEFNVPFYKSFDLVFNALDNLAARRHVNKMCLAADVPLIESGTTGYNGQVQPIRRGKTECYDCSPKPVQKSYPICTIRSTPSQTIHCIVWAKSYLLPELFGESGEAGGYEETEGEDAAEVAQLRAEAAELRMLRTLAGAELVDAVVQKVFVKDIQRLCGMKEMWAHRKPPTPLDPSRLHDKQSGLDAADLALQDQRILSIAENFAVFAHALEELKSRSRGGSVDIEFDKDDPPTLHFVSAAANLRAAIFGLPLQSEWEIKRMAGNIIPAIATSNALVASLCVMQGIKILANNRGLEGCKMVFLTAKSADRIVAAQPLAPPNPACAVCSCSYARVRVPEKGATLRDLLDFLTANLGYDSEDVSIAAQVGVIYEVDFDDNLQNSLWQYFEKGGFVVASDNTKVDLVLWGELADGELRIDDGEESQVQVPEKYKSQEEDKNDDVTMDDEGESVAGVKRKRSPDNLEEEDVGGNKVLVVEDGVIVL